MTNFTSFNQCLTRWDLKQDGEPIITPTSELLPVRYKGIAAMLKVALIKEEQIGNQLMAWWNGDGAAPVFAIDEKAVLLERAEGAVSLVNLAQSGHDDKASQIICAVAARLHAHKNKEPPPALTPLSHWFNELYPAANQYGGVLLKASAAAKELLTDQQDIVVLHGDIHHGNILDFGPRGFLAIDPKGLVGERGFDFANIFCNPDFEIATKPGRLAHQLDVVSKAANLEPKRLLKWVLAYAGLSAAWSIQDGMDPKLALTVAEIVITHPKTRHHQP